MDKMLKDNIESLFRICDDIKSYGIVSYDVREKLRLEMVFLLLAYESKSRYNDVQFRIFKDYLIEDLNSHSDLDMIISKVNVRNIDLSNLKDAVNCAKLFKDIDISLNNMEFKTSLFDVFYTIISNLSILYIEASDTDDFYIKKYQYQVLRTYLSCLDQLKGEPIDINVKVSEDKDLDALILELDHMIGLDKVKQEVKNRVNMIKVNKLREAKGLKTPPISLHLVFSGNPGTGKTTVARLIAKIYNKLGVLSSDHIKEVDRGGLVGKYIGHTESKVKSVVEEAMGGVLFIDEAYSLTVGKKEDDFGYIAVDTLLKLMEDHRDNLVVIVAGYSDKMDQFINHSNEGLASRFNTFIEFEDYTPKELIMIFEKICKDNDYKASDECISYLWDKFYELYKDRDESFANGRLVRNMFEKIIVNQTNRIVTMNNPSEEDMITITLEDVNNI